MAFRKFLVFLLIYFSSCAYFNTFYNAKVYFKQAEKIFQAQGRNTPEASAKYNKVIEKCLKIFEYYKTSSYVDDALYLSAISYKRIGDYTKARTKFEELYKFFPDSPYAVKALPEYADLLLSLGMTEEVRGIMRKYPTAFRSSEFLPVRIRMLFIEGRYKDIVELVDENWKTILKFPNKQEVLKLAIDAAMKVKNYPAAEKFLKYRESLVSSDNDRLFVILNRIDIFISRGEYQEALKILDSAPFAEDSDQSRIIKYEKAKIYMQTNEYEKALAILQNILDNPKRDSTFIKALLLKGKIMESLDSLNVALSIYQELKNFPLKPELRAEVDIRYNSLLEVTSESNSDDYSILRKAELFFLDLNNLSKAIELYRNLAEHSENPEVVCRALYSLAVIYRLYLKDKETAEFYEDKLIREYPESPQAEKINELKNLNLK
ncbi:MAG: tetratricopeptide repeat protein [Candidatus Hydrothermia bacterium]